MSIGRFLLGAAGSYFVGIAIAAAVASLSGGSMILLIGYSLAAGVPFALAATVLGLIFRKTLFRHLALSMLAVPLLIAALWFALGLQLGELFDETRVGLYAVFCSACCAAVAFFWFGRELRREG